MAVAVVPAVVPAVLSYWLLAIGIAQLGSGAPLHLAECTWHAQPASLASSSAQCGDIYPRAAGHSGSKRAATVAEWMLLRCQPASTAADALPECTRRECTASRENCVSKLIDEPLLYYGYRVIQPQSTAFLFTSNLL